MSLLSRSSRTKLTTAETLNAWGAGGPELDQSIVLTDSLDVGARIRVYADLCPLFDKERDVHDEAGLGLGGLCATGRGVTLEPGVRLHDRELHRHRQFDADHFLAEEHHFAEVVLLEVFRGIAHFVGRHRDLLERLGVHEVVELVVAVEVLHFAALDDGSLELCARLDGLVDSAAAAHVTKPWAVLVRA